MWFFHLFAGKMIQTGMGLHHQKWIRDGQLFVQALRGPTLSFGRNIIANQLQGLLGRFCCLPQV